MKKTLILTKKNPGKKTGKNLILTKYKPLPSVKKKRPKYS